MKPQYTYLQKSAFKRIWRLGVVALLTSFLVGTGATAGTLQQLPSGFISEPVISGLDSPASLNFAPDGRMFIGERLTGRLLIAKLNGSGDWVVNPEPFYTFSTPQDFANGELVGLRSAGLRDFAFDPDFANNGYIYVYYMPDSTRQNRLVRIKARNNNPDLADPSSETLLMEVPSNSSTASGSHNGGGVAFGSDGKLYFSTGDGWDGGDSVQSLTTYTGKIFRINKDGSIPPDNPFYTQTTGNYRAIFALGLRNPYSISRHPETGQIYVNEARGSNKADVFLLEAGANYKHQGATIGTPKSAWANVSSAGGKLVTGGAWYPQGGTFPATYHGVYFTPLWGSNVGEPGQINYVRSQTNTTVNVFEQSTSVNDSLGAPLKPVTTRVGPDGNLYYLLTTYRTPDGIVQRVRPTTQSTVAPPIINPAGGQYTAPVNITLSTTTSNATLYYTLDGSLPTTASTPYSGEFTLAQSATVKARAFKNGLNASSITSAVFTFGTPGGSIPPVADAGPDQTVRVGGQVYLNGGNSYDPDGDDLLLTNENWVQLSGPSVTLGDADDDIAYFTPTQTGIYRFRFSVSDLHHTSSDETTVTVVEQVFLSFIANGNINGVAFRDEDIIAYSLADGSYTLYFDGSDVGVGGADVDGFHLLPDNSILMSFNNSSVNVPGVGSVADADIVRFTPSQIGPDTSGSFALYFDGSDVELTTSGEDVDAIALVPDGRLLISVAGSLRAGGVTGKDEDIFAFTPSQLGENTSGSWSLYFVGAKVELSNSGSEDIAGAWVDSSNGLVYLTTLGNFATNGVIGDGADVFTCVLTTQGANTNCTGANLYLDGSSQGLAGQVIDGLFIALESGGSPSPTSTPTSTPTNPPTATPLPTATALPDATPTPAATPPAGGFLGDIYVSTVQSGSVNGIDFTAEDILVHSAGTWRIFFDASDVGLNGAGVSAFHLMNDGSLLLSFDASRTNPPGLTNIKSSDIVRFIPTSSGENTAGTFELYFDGSDVSLTTTGESIDAIAQTGEGHLLISTKANLSTGSFSAKEYDLVIFNATQLGDTTAGTLALFFDGSDVGLTESGEDINGAWFDANGNQLYLTTEGTLSVPGLVAGEADIVTCTLSSPGSNTTCAFVSSVFWSSAAHGLVGQIIDGIYIDNRATQTNAVAAFATDRAEVTTTRTTRVLLPMIIHANKAEADVTAATVGGEDEDPNAVDVELDEYDWATEAE